jgi:hypothetical protein
MQNMPVPVTDVELVLATADRCPSGPSSFPNEICPSCRERSFPLPLIEPKTFEGSPDAEQQRRFPCKWRFLTSSAEFHICGRERTVGSLRADLACHPVVASSSVVGHVGRIRRRLWRPFHLSACQCSVICTGNRAYGEELVPDRDETGHPFVAFVSNPVAIRSKQRRACGAVRAVGNAIRVCPLNITCALRCCWNEEHQHGCDDE